MYFKIDNHNCRLIFLMLCMNLSKILKTKEKSADYFYFSHEQKIENASLFLVEEVGSTLFVDVITVISYFSKKVLISA